VSTLWVKESVTPYAAKWILHGPLASTLGGYGRGKLAMIEQVPIEKQIFFAHVFGVPDDGARARFTSLEEAKAYCEVLSKLENS
jgi:hypothetical protein